jgi:CBS domain containing-hemolysin-like protein
MIFVLPLAIALLILLSATLAASETALFSLARMEHTREQMSQSVQNALDRLMRRPLESLIVIIGLNEACNIFADCLATIFLIAWLGDDVGPYVAAPAMLLIVLIFCDITPKTFALGFPGALTWITARPLAFLVDFLHPFARYFTPIQKAPEPGPVSEKEFKALLRLGENQGQVEPAEREMIHRVFDFGARRVQEIMTPRDRIFSIDIETSVPELMAEIAQESFSRVPVYRRSQDNIVGILHAKDLAARRLDPSPPRVERLVRPAYFIPPGKMLADLFDEMRRGRFQIALVVNEYGRLLGLVTLEDLLEELFGEIHDEFDTEVPELARISDTEWTASGAVGLGKLADALAPARVIDVYGGGKTLGSLILRRLGRVPRVGEKLRLGEFDVTIERVRGAAVEVARLQR